MEKNGIVLTELSCRTAAELPPPELPKHLRQSGSSSGGSSAAVRQLSSVSTIPFPSMSPPPDCRRSFSGSGGGSSAAVGKRSSAGPQNLSYALIGGGGEVKWEVIFKCAQFLRRRGCRN